MYFRSHVAMSVRLVGVLMTCIATISLPEKRWSCFWADRLPQGRRPGRQHHLLLVARFASASTSAAGTSVKLPAMTWPHKTNIV